MIKIPLHYYEQIKNGACSVGDLHYTYLLSLVRRFLHDRDYIVSSIAESKTNAIINSIDDLIRSDMDFIKTPQAMILKSEKGQFARIDIFFQLK